MRPSKPRPNSPGRFFSFRLVEAIGRFFFLKNNAPLACFLWWMFFFGWLLWFFLVVWGDSYLFLMDFCLLWRSFGKSLDRTWASSGGKRSVGALLRSVARCEAFSSDFFGSSLRGLRYGKNGSNHQKFAKTEKKTKKKGKFAKTRQDARQFISTLLLFAGLLRGLRWLEPLCFGSKTKGALSK